MRDKTKFLKQNAPYLVFFYLGNIFAKHILAFENGDFLDKIMQGILESLIKLALYQAFILRIF